TLEGFAEESSRTKRPKQAVPSWRTRRMILRVHLLPVFGKAGSIRSTSGRSTPTRSRSSTR
ncbi:hypothetical protein, partial [Pseudenhygromyxa sp. WMMC2535]|uniref:hypothetical protein n=1 Tax=Pseudenhygromyxa sp. WMMC2535 TaxID=2712867 RepID=UPI001C3C49B8